MEETADAALAGDDGNGVEEAAKTRLGGLAVVDPVTVFGQRLAISNEFGGGASVMGTPARRSYSWGPGMEL